MKSDKNFSNTKKLQEITNVLNFSNNFLALKLFLAEFFKH